MRSKHWFRTTRLLSPAEAALSGVDDAPDWPISIDAVQTGTPTPQVYDAYVQARG